MNNQQHNANNSEVEFELIGLYSFFNEENDKNINWEEFFQFTDDKQIRVIRHDCFYRDSFNS
ncbi:MAG: hypothetical protein R6U85_13300 [Salinivirgaceae bacterium]